MERGAVWGSSEAAQQLRSLDPGVQGRGWGCFDRGVKE